MTSRGLVLGMLALLGALVSAPPAARAAGKPAAPGSVLTGSVGHVKDGDSLVILSGGQRVEVRIAAIDAPELGQPFGRKARQALIRRVEGREVRLEVVDHDRYGRTVGRLLVGESDVGRELVREGAAWVSRRYGHDLELYDLESDARRARRGLWALPEAERVPPWEWRDAHPRRPSESSGSERKTAPASPPEGARPFFGQPPGLGGRALPGSVCGAKRYCGEMTSCAEARFHLLECGLGTLDGDGDGVPCESLCRR